MPNLYMVLIGCKPKGRHTEQHDVFFGIASSMEELIPAIKSFWPEAKGKMHIDGWRVVNNVNGYTIKILPKTENQVKSENQLFFINLGGYKPYEFEEFHYKMLVAAKTKNEAIKMAKQTTFFKHTGFDGAFSHIDDKYGIDVDDIYQIDEILSAESKQNFQIITEPDGQNTIPDEMHLGYFPLKTFE